MCVLIGGLLAACAAGSVGSEGAEQRVGASSAPLAAQDAARVAHGRNLWLKATFGGEAFFSTLLPRALGLNLGLAQVLTTPRAERFTRWGVVNDPDCTDGDASTGGLDRCPPDVDPSDPDLPFEGAPSGVVGLRTFPNPAFDPRSPPSASNAPILVGVACAGCHAGLDAQRPPADPNHPAWENIALTTGNQFLQAGKIFSANLAETDPRWQVFHSWAPGTVDTTAIESDGINDPGIITQFFVFPERPTFDVSSSLVDLTRYGDGTPPRAHRAGQGGEDDVGCELAATRVYFNIGMCAAECMLPHLANGPGGAQTPIDLDACAAACPQLVAEEARVADECAFINDAASTPPPRLADAPGGRAFIDESAVARGAAVFAAHCAGCHANGAPRPFDDYTDDRVHRATGFDPLRGEAPGDIGTNACRSATTNWLGGHIWADFSSDALKARGPGFYRDVPLLGVWATAPFFHNNRLGGYRGDPSVPGRVAAFEDAYDALVRPWKRDFAGSIEVTTAPVTLTVGALTVTLPAGTPVGVFANLDPATLTLRCDDFVENGGHYFGALLSDADKYALRELLKTL